MGNTSVARQVAVADVERVVANIESRSSPIEAAARRDLPPCPSCDARRADRRIETASRILAGMRCLINGVLTPVGEEQNNTALAEALRLADLLIARVEGGK